MPWPLATGHTQSFNHNATAHPASGPIAMNRPGGWRSASAGVNIPRTAASFQTADVLRLSPNWWAAPVGTIGKNSHVHLPPRRLTTAHRETTSRFYRKPWRQTMRGDRGKQEALPCKVLDASTAARDNTGNMVEDCGLIENILAGHRSARLGGASGRERDERG